MPPWARSAMSFARCGASTTKVVCSSAFAANEGHRRCVDGRTIALIARTILTKRFQRPFGLSSRVVRIPRPDADPQLLLPAVHRRERACAPQGARGLLDSPADIGPPAP